MARKKHISKNEPLKILFVAAEAYPYAEVGGLSRVAYFLPRALVKLGHDVRVMIPRYGKIDQERFPLAIAHKSLRVPTNGKPEYLTCNIKKATPEENLTFYFLENMEYYEKRTNEYGYSDDPTRFSLLARGTIEFLKHSDWIPDVIHTNEWHTATLAQYLKTSYSKIEKLSKITTVFTIHNLAFQGSLDHRFVSELDRDDGHSDIPGFFESRLKKLNFMRRGIMYSDLVTTVSPTYAKEILTPQYGEGLHNLLLETRTKLVGVLNGLDYEEFNPETDQILVKTYNADTIENRIENKITLQREFNLPEDETIPIIAYNGRLYGQKGIDLMMKMLEPLLKEYSCQLIINGGGDPAYRQYFLDLAKKYPQRVGVNVEFDFNLPRHIYAGADIILIPSAYEPCGIVQMEAMRYGAIPVVRKTGGLADTVKNFNPENETGTGFVFTNYSDYALFAAIVRALENYRYKDVWQSLIKRAMNQDLSWTNSARLYQNLYYRAIGLKFQKEESKILNTY